MTTSPAVFCNCYVSNLDLEVQFSLRYGAHALSCPVYRASSDPVDNAEDCLYRSIKNTGCGMINLYIYSIEDNSHVATITGGDNASCEAKADDMYGSNDYGWTYSPAFGFSGGLKENGVEVTA